MTDEPNELDRAEAWWAGLSLSWQRAFRATMPEPGPDDQRPEPTRLLELLSLEALRFAGPRAPYPNLDFELPDLDGVAELRSLRVLSVTDMPIRSVRPLAALTALEDLFVQDNEIESLEGIENLTGLRALYCQGNRIESLAPIESLTKLKTLYASRNRLRRIDGLHAGHAPSLEQFFILPNDALEPAEIARVQTRLGIPCRRG